LVRPTHPTYHFVDFLGPRGFAQALLHDDGGVVAFEACRADHCLGWARRRSEAVCALNNEKQNGRSSTSVDATVRNSVIPTPISSALDMDFHLLNEVVMPWRVIVTRAEAGLCVADSLREPDTAGVTVLMRHPARSLI
jgi:hypothetical protein